MVDLSLYGTAVRTYVWNDIYGQFEREGINFELIFVGPQSPDFALPENFKYIKTTVKPSQCVEIARKQCTGRYVLYTTDDLIFPPGTLKGMIAYLDAHPSEKLAVSPMYRDYGEPFSYEYYQRFNPSNPNSVIVGVCCMMSRELSDEIGGIDRNFVSLAWDLDRLIRLYQLGGRLHLIREFTIFENQPHGLLRTGEANVDREFLRSLYGIDGVLQRQRPVEEFEEEGIMKASQGVKGNGRWV